MVKINMMCGRRDFGYDWIHIDTAGFQHINSMDITLSGQFPNSVDLIYCSHGIAYFDKYELNELLAQWFHKLRPGGMLRVATPDFEVMAGLYLNGSIELHQITGPLYGRMRGENGKIFHRMAYDEASLTKVLETAGFEFVDRYDHARTEHPNTGDREDRFDDHSAAYINGILISLNIQCNKPL